MGCVGNATARPLYPRERPGTQCIGHWVGPMAGLGRCGKSRPPLVFDPRTVRPVASCYTDCAIPVHSIQPILSEIQRNMSKYLNLFKINVRLLLIRR